ncbi:MAG: patatin-like phospholipase family protein, partial [Chloroflexi bacterium]|nr:patatin-like phospholipase family protein [Chloroflexota bacterium]
MTRRALILAGGGYKVAFQAGVLQVWLDEAGLEFDHADGASGGNLNLAMWCQGMSGTRIADK